MEGMPVNVLARMTGTSVAMIEKHYGHYDPIQGAAYLERSVAADQKRKERATCERGQSAPNPSTSAKQSAGAVRSPSGLLW